jgi:hypothetical protein
MQAQLFNFFKANFLISLISTTLVDIIKSISLQTAWYNSPDMNLPTVPSPTVTRSSTWSIATNVRRVEDLGDDESEDAADDESEHNYKVHRHATSLVPIGDLG